VITALVEFSLPQPITRDQAKDTFQGTAPKYRGVPGLLRKYYVLSPDGRKAGGIYLWQSRAAAEQVYTAEWRAFVRGKYGADPTITWFECPVVVDNLTDTITSD
jgi:Putative mono-oxygenase ydhR